MSMIPFAPPDITAAEIEAVTGVLQSGWLTTGPVAAQLERELAAFCGTPRAVCVSSATAAMELVLRLLGIGEGDEVITSAYTYTATAAAIGHTGARAVLADTAPGSYLLGLQAVERLVTPRTRAILAVDVGGVVCDYAALRQLAAQHAPQFRPASPMQERLGRIAVIADAAHSLGASRCGVRSGALADFSCFSFHAVKNLTTGEGGAITWNTLPGLSDEAVYRALRVLSLHGQDRDALAKAQAGGWAYDILCPGFKCNLPDILAAIGLSQLRRYEQSLARRHRLCERYNARFASCPAILPLPHRDRSWQSSAHLYMVRLVGRCEKERNAVLARMAERGVMANVHYRPLPLLTAYRERGYTVGECPNALEMYRSELTLPLYPQLTDAEADRVCSTLLECL